MTRSSLRGAVVTGASGSLGSILVSRLEREGVPTVAVTRRAVGLGSANVVGELDSPELWERVGKLIPDPEGCAVFHMAAVISDFRCAADPHAAVRLNVGGTGAVLEATRRLAIARFVFPSTGLVYAAGGEPHDEADELDPASLYAATKAAGEQLVRGYAACFGLRCVIARLSNLYGPRSAPESLAGRLFAQAVAGGPLRVRTSTPVRDFLHAEDAAEALTLAAVTEGVPRTWTVNVSTGTGTSVGAFAALVGEIAGVQGPLIDEHATEAGSPVVLSSAHLRALTGWRPSLDLVAGISRTLLALQQERP